MIAPKSMIGLSLKPELLVGCAIQGGLKSNVLKLIRVQTRKFVEGQYLGFCELRLGTFQNLTIYL